MKIGIVGSSYSVGLHTNGREHSEKVILASRFETWLEKHTTGMEFFNAACAGKGTELYLNKVVYLKNKFNIDCLLIEVIQNRSMLNVKCMPDAYKSIIKDTDIAQLEHNVYKNSSSGYDHWRSIEEPIEEQTQLAANKKSFDTWKEVQWNIAAIDNSTDFWGVLDIYQTIKLCKMLGIKCVLWANKTKFSELPIFENMLQEESYIKFGIFPNAFEYYVNKYGKKNILCDHAHFNDSTNEEMVKDFIAPMIRVQQW
jgi:hypothetical protein